MKIAVDTEHNITQLFKIITDNLKAANQTPGCFLENYIIISYENVKVKKIVAKSIAEFILNEYEKDLAYSIIKPFEIPKIDAENVLKLMSEDDELKQKRLKLIEREILSDFALKHINVDGIVRFRLIEYKKELQFTVELLIDEIMVKKSYDDFIGLMKYFTEIQAPITDTVILTENSGEYTLTDISGKPLTLKFDEEFSEEIMPFDLSGEDLLISNLMAAMPGKIIFKNVNTDKPIINTITQIFEGRITH